MAVNYQNKIVKDGLVLCLDAADKKSYPGTGTTWFDRSGNGNNGTLAGGPTFSGDNGGSIVFDGTNDYSLIQANPSFQLGNGYSLCAWVKASNNPPGYVGICGTFDSIPNNYFGQNFSIQPNTQTFSFLVAGWSGGSYNYINATIQYSIGKWYYLVGTNSGTNCSFYIDGILNTTYTQSDSAANCGLTTMFKIGRFYQSNDNYYLQGNIAIVKYYNRALTPQEIKQNFNATRGRFGI